MGTRPDPHRLAPPGSANRLRLLPRAARSAVLLLCQERAARPAPGVPGKGRGPGTPPEENLGPTPARGAGDSERALRSAGSGGDTEDKRLGEAAEEGHHGREGGA